MFGINKEHKSGLGAGMIRQWEILHYPSMLDANRYRISLWSDGSDVSKIRMLFPERVGAVWVPRRKPYNCAFFVYGSSPEEKAELEELLSGKAPFPEAPSRFVPAKPMDEHLTKEDTQEVLLMDAIIQEEKLVTTGLGGNRRGNRVVRVGYFVPDYMPDAGEKVHEILLRTLFDKKVSVTFEKVFSVPFGALTLKEVHRLLKECQNYSVTRAIAIGEPSSMEGLCRKAKESGIFITPLAESVINKNLWLTMIAEILSHD